jgi:tRNA A37 N6-isopentenylltransferase MiaA
MPIIKKTISSYDDIKEYFLSHYGDAVNKFLDIAVLEISSDLWKKFYFVGYGYVVRKSDWINNYIFLETAAKSNTYYQSLPSDEHKRDVNIYKLSKQINHPGMFIMVKQDPNSKFFIIHELSHLIDKSEFEILKFNDEYLDKPSEQFAYLNEMRYAKKTGLSFEEYFKNTHPEEYSIIKEHKENYELAKMDERDYKKMWDYLDNKKASSNKFIKTSQYLSMVKKQIKGKYGTFDAYILPGNTKPIKEQLKILGFKWYGPENVWWISAKSLTNHIRSELAKLGVAISEEDSVRIIKEEKPEEKLPESPLTPAKKQWQTEDEEMSRWYGFPINKNIYTIERDINVNGTIHKVIITIDRSYRLGKSSSTYTKTKSREHRGLPKYMIHCNVPDINLTYDMRYLSKQKWGTYDEEEFLAKDLTEMIDKNIIADPKSKLNMVIDDKDRIIRRDPLYKQFLKDIEDKKISPEYNFHINNDIYGGDYKVKIYWLGMGENAMYATLEPMVDNPNAPSDTFGYQEINIENAYSIQDFHDTINNYLRDNHDKVQEQYIKYLKSFPFLPSQQEEAQQQYTTIKNIVANSSSNADFVLKKIQEKGYIRPSKKQKQESPGLTMGEEIHWVVDSKKIVNDAYNFGGYSSRTPEYFYSVVAYYVHRKIRGIWSWTDMMLVDAMSTWMRTMNDMGAGLDFKEVNKAIEDIGNIIVQKVSGKITAEQRSKNFSDWFYGRSESTPGQSEQPDYGALKDFAEIAQQYGISIEGIEENAKNIYRSLAKQLHPDMYLDPVKKEEATEKFKQLQQIWDKMPEQYKKASNWYERYIFGASSTAHG